MVNKQKLTKQQREEVARLYWVEGYATTVLGEMFNCSAMNIWKHAQKRKEKYVNNEEK